MQPKFNIDRPKVSDDEINKHKDFDKLVKQFKEQSINKAKSDKSWWKNNYIKYAAVIAGVTVICTVTYTSLFKKQNADDKIITKNEQQTKAPNTPTKFINEPFQKAKVNYTSYKVDNSKGADIKHPSNSKIKIPKSTFVNKQGEEIKGEVEILYREIHDQAEIIASGIPMTYDSAGIRSTFESAGMFEIKGYQNGEPVFIKKDQPLTVELCSKDADDHFNQYYLDTVAKNWQYIKRDNPVALENAKPQSAEDKAALKKLDQKYLPAINAIPKRIDSVKVVYTKKIDKLEKPAQPAKPNKSSGRPQFELDVDYKEFPELAAFKNAQFEIGAENQNFDKSLTAVTWSSADISEGPTKGKNYLLTLKLRDRVEKLIVYPVLSGSDYEAAEKKYEDKFEKYKTLLAKREADEKKLKEEMEAKQAAYLAQQKKLEAELIRERVRLQQQEATALSNRISSGGISGVISRVFSVSNFGIYNSDCAQPMPQGQVINPIFVLNDDSKPIFPGMMYLIETNRNIVFNFTPDKIKNISIDPFTQYSACLISGSNVYVISKEEFAKVINEKGNKFTVQKLSSDISDLFELKKAMGFPS
ncbi:MAG: OmpH family outer membrane protein [Sphingobacteriaceae bacterium]